MLLKFFRFKGFILSFFASFHFSRLASTSTRPYAAHARRLGGGEGLAETGTTLSAGKVVAANNLLGLLDNLLSLGEDELDVAGVRHVGVDLDVMLALGGFGDSAIRGLVGVYVHDRGHGTCVCAAWGPG